MSSFHQTTAWVWTLWLLRGLRCRYGRRYDPQFEVVRRLVDRERRPASRDKLTSLKAPSRFVNQFRSFLDLRGRKDVVPELELEQQLWLDMTEAPHYAACRRVFVFTVFLYYGFKVFTH